MKKIISIILALVIVASSLSLVSCTGEAAQNLVNDALVKAKAADAYEANMSVVLTMHLESEEKVYPYEIHVVTKDAHTETPEIILQRAIFVLGKEFIIYTYTDSEDWAYVVTGASNSKIPYEDSISSVDTSEITSLLFKYPPMMFEGLIPINNSDGSKTVKFSVESNMFHELYRSILDSIKADMGTENSNYIKVRNAEVAITVDDGDLKNYVITFDAESTVDGQKKSASVAVTLDFLAFGDDVNLTPPEGYLDYPVIEPEDGSAVME